MSSILDTSNEFFINYLCESSSTETFNYKTRHRLRLTVIKTEKKCLKLQQEIHSKSFPRKILRRQLQRRKNKSWPNMELCKRRKKAEWFRISLVALLSLSQPTQKSLRFFLWGFSCLIHSTKFHSHDHNSQHFQETFQGFKNLNTHFFLL